MTLVIRFTCNHCGARIRAQEGQSATRGRCPSCKELLDIPDRNEGSRTPQQQVPLSDATAEDILAEVQSRGSAGILLTFDRPTEETGSVESLRVTYSENLSDQLARRVLIHVASIANKPPQKRTATQVTVEPYEFKGDRLGMSLTDFKSKYRRKAKGDSRFLPFCSDDEPQDPVKILAGVVGDDDPALNSLKEELSRQEPNVSLLEEDWHKHAGIVSCRKEYPFELLNGRKPETVAGIPTEIVVYRFVEGRLYMIVVTFDTDYYETVEGAMLEKYGEATEVSKKPRKRYWTNGVTSVGLCRGRINPSEWSQLIYSHDELLSRVNAVAPNRSEDL